MGMRWPSSANRMARLVKKMMKSYGLPALMAVVTLVVVCITGTVSIFTRTPVSAR